MVHIWVESIFEFFGVAVIALFLVTLGLVTAQSALRVAYLTAILVFLGGIPGTAHHYFWFGGPSFWLALGGVFSSLEPIPLILLVVRAWMEYRSIRKEGKEFPYRWPLYFLVASSFWNFLGAGIFGFMINLPIINYYEHATYLTANHAHSALFGVYGMLAVSLILFSWRGLVEKKHWNDRLLKISFYHGNSINVKHAEAALEVAEADLKISLEANKKVPGTISPLQIRKMELDAKRLGSKVSYLQAAWVGNEKQAGDATLNFIDANVKYLEAAIELEKLSSKRDPSGVPPSEAIEKLQKQLENAKKDFEKAKTIEYP